MDYRDERDALRARVENLEQHLAEALAAHQAEISPKHADDKATRVAELERQVTKAQRLLRHARTELAADVRERERRERAARPKGSPHTIPTGARWRGWGPRLVALTFLTLGLAIPAGRLRRQLDACEAALSCCRARDAHSSRCSTLVGADCDDYLRANCGARAIALRPSE